MDTRVFWSVLCALLVFSGLVVAGVATMYVAQQQAVAQAQDQAQQRIAAISEQARQDFEAGQRQQAAFQRSQLERRRLASNERCVGGAVVRVQGNAYTQLGTIGQPVHCSGDLADQSLR